MTVGLSEFYRLYRVISFKIVIASRIKGYSIITAASLNSSSPRENRDLTIRDISAKGP